ncbi:GntR family transcriptional regulator [Salipiger sp. H15]|uniref:GntR family transcriptional regulator n=1 Tax=Alloyangia sp. H15 TaxID=3029062 RepID=A0AAU8APT5_9RHOB
MARLNAVESDVYDRIRTAIGERRLLPGQRLREVELCRIFGTTRGTIRKVLARLAFDGLVDHEPNRGASVARPTARQAADLFVARRCIEQAIAREALARVSPADEAKLRTHIAREHGAREAGDRRRIIALSGEFHVLLSQIAANTVLSRYLVDLIAQESLIIQLFEKPGADQCSCDEHAGIAEALLARDGDRLARLIDSHIDGIAGSLDLEQRGMARPNLDDVFAEG